MDQLWKFEEGHCSRRLRNTPSNRPNGRELQISRNNLTLHSYSRLRAFGREFLMGGDGFGEVRQPNRAKTNTPNVRLSIFMARKVA